MQINKIHSINYCGAKNPRQIQKLAKPAAEEIKTDINHFSYSAPTDKVLEPAKATMQKAVETTEYFYYGNPVNTVKKVTVTNAPDKYLKETEIIMTKETPTENIGYITDSMM